MPEPTRPVSPRDKRAAAQLMAEQRYKKRLPPAPEVDAALKALQGPPSPEQIAQISMELARGPGGVPAAIEFETYAKNLVIERARSQAESSYAQGRAPDPRVDQSLRSTGGTAPSPQQIEAEAAKFDKISPELGQQYRAYVQGLTSDRLAAQEGQLSPEHQGMVKEQAARAQANPQPAPPPVLGRGSPTAPVPRQQPAPAAGSAPAAPAPPGNPPPAPAKADNTASSLLQRAKDTLQGVGSVLTLGYIPVPESVKRGNRVLREKVGLDEKEKKDESR